jgi:hypothetical protein
MTKETSPAPLTELQQTSNQNVFVMMRYRTSPHFKEIEDCLRDTLSEFGLIARLAKDRAIVDDLWENIVLYMRHSRFGIALFEDIDEREFNPNISLELGYMYALGKRCLLLKEKRMPRLPTDIYGRIYRDFDILHLRSSIEEQLRAWCEKDLQLRPIGQQSHIQPADFMIAYDNLSEDPEFRTWGVFSSDGLFAHHIRLQRDSETGRSGTITPFIDLSASNTVSVGINKDFKTLCGRVRFEYRAVHSDASNPNLLFCMIPMQGKPNQLLEAGAKEVAEPANAYSPYRLRYFVPESQINDGAWHQASIDFDFTGVPGATYSIFAPRINEGCPRPGGGRLHVGNTVLLIPVPD